MSGIKIIIILAIALALTLVIALVVVPKIKRKKLSEGIFEFITDKGGKISLEEISTGINKLNNVEVNTFIEFATALKEKKFLQIPPLLKPMSPILVKSGLATLMDKIL